MSKDICKCGHTKRGHIYEELACRTGLVCPCDKYREAPASPDQVKEGRTCEYPKAHEARQCGCGDVKAPALPAGSNQDIAADCLVRDSDESVLVTSTIMKIERALDSCVSIHSCNQGVIDKLQAEVDAQKLRGDHAVQFLGEKIAALEKAYANRGDLVRMLENELAEQKSYAIGLLSGAQSTNRYCDELRKELREAQKALSEERAKVVQMRDDAFAVRPEYFAPDERVDAIGVQLDIRKKILDAIGWPSSSLLTPTPPKGSTSNEQ